HVAKDLVGGQMLDRWTREPGRMDGRTALGLIAAVVPALAQAPAAGIVHRDIKPENILLVSGGVVSGGEAEASRPENSPLPTPHSPRVKLTDFGLARHIVESESLNVTRAGAVLGTPLYMAPEQCAGEAVDARTDIYALGATLYHLLAGRPPFEASNP